MKQFSLLLICTAILFSCCKDKDDDKKPDITPNGNVAGHPLDELGLPYATTEGLNTMGCLINGEPWLAITANFTGALHYRIPFELASNGQLNINVIRQYDGFADGIQLNAFPVQEIGEYSFGSPTSIYQDIVSGCGSYNLDTTYTNIIMITMLDTDAEILSGTFEMRVTNENCDTLTITNGRFDLSS